MQPWRARDRVDMLHCTAALPTCISLALRQLGCAHPSRKHGPYAIHDGIGGSLSGTAMAYETRRHSYSPAFLIRRAYYRYACLVVDLTRLSEPFAVASDRCACHPRKAANAGQERACSSDIIGAGPPAFTARAAQGAVSTVSEETSMQQGYKRRGTIHRGGGAKLFCLLVTLFRRGSASGSNVPVVISFALMPWLSQSTEHLLLIGQTPVLIRGRLM